MYTLFNLKPHFNVPVLKLPDWTNIETRLKYNLDKLIKHYQSQSHAVPSQHTFISLLMNLNIPMNLELSRYYYNVMERAPEVCRTLGYTSSLVRGKTHRHVLFGGETEELILVLDDDFDYEYADAHWRTLRPVEYLRHPSTDLTMPIPNTKRPDTEPGVSIITIHPALMAIQYRAFRNHERELAKQIPDYTPKSINQYIHAYVYSNTLPSYLDHALFNRLLALATGAPLPTHTSSHSIALPDYTKRVDNLYTLYLDKIQDRAYDYTTLLRSIPLVTHLNLEDLLTLPDLPLTRQVMWLLLTSRLPALTYLLSTIQTNSNQKEINLIKRYLTRIRYNNQIAQLPNTFKETFQEEVDTLYALLDIE